MESNCEPELMETPIHCTRRGTGDEFDGVRVSEAFQVFCPVTDRLLFSGVPGDYRLFDPIAQQCFGVSASDMERDYVIG